MGIRRTEDTSEERAVDGDGVTVERRSPEESFALLADETRVGILRAMGERPDEPVTFERLRERVGARDSGGFSYHLRKLGGTFVRKTDDGYELTHAGRQAVGAMYAGTYTADATVDPVPVDGACPLCGGDIVAAYADELATTACTDCGEWYNEFSFPPGSLEGFAREELPEAFDRWMRHVFDGIVAGFCDTCEGRVDGRLVLDEGDGQRAEAPAHAEFACRRCGATSRCAVGMVAMSHTGVRGFLYDRGVDVGTDPTWEVSATLDRKRTAVRSTDPPRVAVSFASDGEALSVVVGPDATVESVERGPLEA